MADFQNLSIPERLELIEQIWDSIAKDADHIVMTTAQQQHLEEQLESFYAGPEPGQPVSETVEALRGRRLPLTPSG